MSLVRRKANSEGRECVLMVAVGCEAIISLKSSLVSGVMVEVMV